MQKYLMALSITGWVDAISYMIVAPSIIFYVYQLGGTKEQYGIILSAFSFASFCTKPFLGLFSDRSGFRLPYLLSLVGSSLGGLVYALASLCSRPQSAIAMILLGRILGGMGAANSSLAFAYSAKVVPQDQQTKVNSLLSMLRILGMAAGPGVNVLLNKIDANVGRLHLDPLNSVGLVLMGSNVVAFLTIYLLLEEPVESHDSSLHKKQSSGIDDTPSTWSVLQSVLCAEIFVPVLSVFVLNANFQLIETGFAPAASHALGWGPVQTSTVLGSISIVIFVFMFVVIQLSNAKVRDEVLVTVGLCTSAIGYSLMYALWSMNAPAWHFALPIIIGASAFPFLAAPSRSIFTKMVDANPFLDKSHGTMQAVLSMSASVAGFTTPGLVAAYVLRHGDEVVASRDHREMTPLALFAPFLSIMTLLGFAYMECKLKRKAQLANIDPDTTTNGEIIVDETTSLLESQARTPLSVEGKCGLRRFSAKVEAHRRHSTCLMGIVQSSLHHEHELPDEAS